ncbi:rare lipoprotein A [Pseudodesulfovibrio hydrargyri]|uniref:Rare lipoprotein A n=1 Tax=Pseudodesulfovibrio hydrargyri TaxID=2125990 RepID=A0A1J5N3V9_9BACT|nr:SPOR domain-containing protein [Pseudodesulfovibrio hydrargyri]OIQ50307.1 rare lipoprotein A [Pseudodesulfovibrio hydrargyri]
MKKTILALAVLTAAALVLGGCFRKHIESAPPVRQPAKQAETAPPPVIEETYVVGDEKPLDEPIDEVYEVDAAKQAGTKPPAVGEDDLAEEPLPDADQLKREAEAAAAQGTPPAVEPPAQQAVEPTVKADAKPAASTVAEPAPVRTPTNPEDEIVGIGDVAGTDGATRADTPAATPAVAAGGPYYVQVGAFSDEKNANRALQRLIADGYKGSVMVKTDEGLFRVQAGSFPDEATAGAALDKLRTDYPKGFVLKKP